jgi:hypothetical protein
MITATQSFEIYEILSRNFKSEQDAKALVKEIENVIENRFQAERDRLATKEDIARLEGLINSKVSEAKADILKWMIALFAPFYIGMIVFLIKHFL